MSIWVKTAASVWTEIQSIYTKVASASWAENLSVWVKTASSTWTQVFNRINIPSISTTPKVRDINGNNIDNDLYISNIGDTLVGFRGTWNGSPTSYEFRWMYSTIEGGTLTAFSPAQAGTFSGTTTNLVTVQAWDDRYVYLQVRATNALGTSDWVTSSNFAHIVKYAPFIYDAKIFRNAIELSGTSAAVSTGQTLTGTYQEITTADQVSDTYLYEWFHNTSTTPISSSGISTTYLTQLSDVGKSIYFKVTGSNTGGESSSTSLATSEITEGYPGYSFNFGNTLYVGTNGYIGLTSGSTSTSLPSTGTVIAIQVGDFVVSDIRRWSSSSTYGVTVDSYRFGYSGQAAYRLKYQAVFYPGEAFMDYRIAAFGSSLTTMGFFGIYYNGALVQSAYPGPFVYGVGTTIRVYYDGSAPAAYVALNEVPPDAAMIQITSPTVGSTDDGYYTITTAANQYAIPFNTLGTASTTSAGISALSTASGNDFSYQEYVVRTGSHFGTVFSTGTINGSTLIVNDLNPGVTYYVTVTPYNTLGQSGTAYQFSAQTVASAGAFNITLVTKTKPASTGGLRTLTVNWSQSANATKYEFALQGSSDGSTGWTTLTFDAGDGSGSKTWTLENSPYYDYGTGSKTFNNVTYYPYYRVTMRARPSDLNLANSAYSNGGTSTSLVYVNATGVAPGKPTLTTPTGTDLTATSVNINYTYPSDTGSNYIDWIQFSTDQVSWTNDFASPYTLTTTANTSYTVYARSLNYDGLTSATPHNFVTFTTPQALAAPTSLTASTTNSTGISLTFSGGFGNSYEVFYSNSTSATDTTSYVKPTAATNADFNGITSSPFNTGLTTRGVHRRFWIRSRVTPNASFWFPDGNGTVGAGAYGYAPLYAPSTVGSLTNSATTSSSLSFWWNAPTTSATADAATSYDYVISTSTATPASWPNNRTTVPTSGAPQIMTGLSASTTYYLHVRAKNADATGASTFVSGTTSAAAVKPGTPSPSATRRYNDITVSWGATTATTSYNLQVSTSNTFASLTLNDTAATSPRQVTSLTAATTYYYRVRAFNADFGYGDWSATGSITTGTFPSFSPATATNPTFDRNNSLSRLRWGWNNPTVSGDYTSISYEWQFSTTASTTGLLASATSKLFRTSGGLTVGASTFNNRISTLTSDYGTGNAAGTSEPVTFNTASRFVRYRARVVGIDGATYTQTYSGWV